MLKTLLFAVLLCLASTVIAAIDIPVEVLESYLKFKGGDELIITSDGSHILRAKLTFRGTTRILEGKVFAGLEQPDLSSVKLKLVANNNGCKPEPSSCLEYSLPLIEISVSGIPELPECSEECTVRFLFKEDGVYRRTSFRKGGVMTLNSQQAYLNATD